jgi:hypothetical protein
MRYEVWLWARKQRCWFREHKYDMTVDAVQVVECMKMSDVVGDNDAAGQGVSMPAATS